MIFECSSRAESLVGKEKLSLLLLATWSRFSVVDWLDWTVLVRWRYEIKHEEEKGKDFYFTGISCKPS